MRPVVIWDWNGTLLDDVQASVQAINMLLAPRGLEPMTLDRYYRIFDFPVRSYYDAMGFDFVTERFEDVAVEYHAAYASVVGHFDVRTDAREALERVRASGASQVVLSALEQGRLRNELARRGLEDHFDAVYGVGDLYAASKEERGRELVADLGLDPRGTWMVGDTTHDAEVAVHLGVSPVLVTGGHHDHARLAALGYPVVPTLCAALDRIGL